jgi:hypothetical protein
MTSNVREQAVNLFFCLSQTEIVKKGRFCVQVHVVQKRIGANLLVLSSANYFF